MQPLLLEMDREMEDAAASLGAGGVTIFRRIIFPNLLPGLAAGRRAGLRPRPRRVRLGPPLRRRPARTRPVSSVFIRSQIESGNEIGAAAVSVVLLVASLLLLASVTLIQRWGARAMTVVSAPSRWGLRVLGLGYLTVLLLAARWR